MKTRANRPVAAIIAGLLMFALLCATGVWWALALFGPRSPVAPPEVSLDPRAPVDLRPAGQLFGTAGGPAAPMQVISNLQVLGVVADPRRGAAVLSVDGRPARVFSVGDEIVPGISVRAIRGDAVIVERDGQRIELPTPARPSVSVLSAGAQGSPASPAPMAAEPAQTSRAPAPSVPSYVPPASAPAASPAFPAPTLPAPVLPAPVTAPASGVDTSAPAPGTLPRRPGAPLAAPSSMSSSPAAPAAAGTSTAQ